MQEGSLSHRYLTRAVLSQITNTHKENLPGPGVGNDFSMVKGFGVGNDFSVIKGFGMENMFPEESENGLVTADGFGESVSVAFFKAMNNFCCSFGECKYARIGLFLPTTTKESQIRALMKEWNDLAQRYGLQILGGDSKVSSRFCAPSFYVTLIGTGNAGFLSRVKSIKPGYEIVQAHATGMLGTNLCVERHFEKMRAHFSIDFLNQITVPPEALSVKMAVDAIKTQKESADAKICYAHDVSQGGVYGALWQLGEKLHKGIFVENGRILIRQETIEASEVVNENPYLMDGTGSILLVCKSGKTLVNVLKNCQINASVIGKVTEGKEYLVRIGPADIRTLSPEDTVGQNNKD